MEMERIEEIMMGKDDLEKEKKNEKKIWKRGDFEVRKKMKIIMDMKINVEEERMDGFGKVKGF